MSDNEKTPPSWTELLAARDASQPVPYEETPFAILAKMKELAREFYFFGRESSDEACAAEFERLWNDQGAREDLRARLKS